jgi:hypothetical protein
VNSQRETRALTTRTAAVNLRGRQLIERPPGRSEVAVTGNILSFFGVFELNTRMI